MSTAVGKTKVMQNLPICGDELQIIYEHDRPAGIRDRGGYLFFFARVDKYQGQDERYKRELEQQFRLADYLLNALQNSNGGK